MTTSEVERQPYAIAVSGNIGVGKTTVARLLATELGATVVAEPVDSNPYLTDFYRQPERWSYHSQTHFLFSRCAVLNEALSSGGQLIIDRTISEDPQHR